MKFEMSGRPWENTKSAHATRGFTKRPCVRWMTSLVSHRKPRECTVKFVKVVCRYASKAYELCVRTKMLEDRRCAAPIQGAMATVLGGRAERSRP